MTQANQYASKIINEAFTKSQAKPSHSTNLNNLDLPYSRSQGRLPNHSLTKNSNPNLSTVLRNSSPLRSQSKSIIENQQSMQQFQTETFDYQRSSALRRQLKEKEIQMIKLQTQPPSQNLKNLFVQETFENQQPLPKFRQGSNQACQHLAVIDGDQYQDQNGPYQHINIINRSPYIDLEQSEQNFHNNRSDNSNMNLNVKQQQYQQRIVEENLAIEYKVQLAQQELIKVQNETKQMKQLLGQVSEQSNSIHSKLGMLQRRDSIVLHQQELAQYINNNKLIQQQIHITDVDRNEAAKKLQFLYKKREYITTDIVAKKVDVQDKLAIIKEIEARRAFDTSKLDRVERQIKQLQLQLLQENRVICEDQLLVDQLMFERSEILGRVQQLSQAFEKAKSDYNQEKQLVHFHCRRQRTLLACKNLYNVFQVLVNKQYRSALNDFFYYCEFDSQCHNALTKFANILNKIGSTMLAQSLTKWYTATFDPIKVQQQRSKLIRKKGSVLQQSKFFKLWQHSLICIRQKKIDVNRALFKLLQFRNKREKFNESVLAFKKWRFEIKVQSQQYRILANVVSRTNSRILRRALQRLSEATTIRQFFARQRCLVVNTTHKQYLTSLLLKFQQSALENKQKRLQRLRHIFKAFKDGIAQIKYLTFQKQQVAKLQVQIQRRTLTQVFYQLRLSKELIKLTLFNTQLQEIVQPQLASLNSSILVLATRQLRIRKVRGFQCLSRYALACAAGYFNKWRQINYSFKNRTKDKLKLFLIRKYRAQIHQAVIIWRRGVRFQVLQELEQISNEYTSTTLGSEDLHSLSASQFVTQDYKQISLIYLQSQIDSLNTQINQEKYRQLSHKQRGLQRCIRTFNKRMQLYGLHKWHQQCNNIISFKAKADRLVSLKRKLICKSAWQIYVAQVQIFPTSIKNQRKVECYQHLRHQRIKRQIYNAILVFVNNFKQQQKNLKLCIYHLDTLVKRRTMQSWFGQTKQLSEIQIRNAQNNSSLQFDNLNENLGEVIKQLHFQNEVNSVLKQGLMKIANGVLSSRFARNYYIQIERGISKWKQYVQSQRHCEKVLSSLILHQNKNIMYCVKAAFQNLRQKEKIYKLKSEIDQQFSAIGQVDSLQKYQIEVHQQKLEQISQMIQVPKHEAQLIKIKWQKTLSVVNRFSQDLNYQSRLRFIFLQWKLFVKRQQTFINSITNVIQKSLWKQVFLRIEQRSIEVQHNQQKLNALLKVSRLYVYKKCQQALSKFRMVRYEEAVIESQNYFNIIQFENERHQQFLDKVSATNCSRVEQILSHRRYQNLWRAWQNVRKWQKQKRIKQSYFQQNYGNYQASKALKKWQERSQYTIKIRNYFLDFNMKYAQIYKKAVFNKLVNRFKTLKRYMNFLAQVAVKHEKKNIQSALQRLKIFTFNQLHHWRISQRHKITLFEQILNKTFKIKKQNYFKVLKLKLFLEGVRFQKLTQICRFQKIQNLRNKFFKWKYQANLESTQIEVNELGPVSEEVFSHRLTIFNYKQFLLDQAYTTQEVNSIVKLSKSKVKVAMRKSLARMQHYNRAAHLKPIAFDRWKLFVKLRKLFKYILRNTENKLTPVKADLSIAFNKWRNHYDINISKLNRKDRIALVAKCAYNQQVLTYYDEVGYSKFQQISESQLTKDELSLQYLRAKNLAISSSRNNYERSQFKSFSQLYDYTRKQKSEELKLQLQRNIECIGQIKEHCNQLEYSNNLIGQDNEELRQMSLDGFDIAQGAQQLSDDRERLSFDLADKAQVIRQLLSQNEQLLRALREQQARNDELQMQLRQHQQL